MRKILILGAAALAILALPGGPIPTEVAAQTNAKAKQCVEGCTKRWGGAGKSYVKCVELCEKGGNYK
jgi:hypothetical protein